MGASRTPPSRPTAFRWAPPVKNNSTFNVTLGWDGGKSIKPVPTMEGLRDAAATGTFSLV